MDIKAAIKKVLSPISENTIMDIDIKIELNAESDETLLLFNVVVLSVVPVADIPTTGSAADTIWNNNGRTNEQNRDEDAIL